MGRGKKIVDIELVVDEAIALIEEGGVEDFSTRRLASRLGISAMTLYNYYENREAILKETLKRGLDMMLAGLPAAVEARRPGGGAPVGAYRALADHVLAFATSRPKLCRFVLTESAGIDRGDEADPIERMCGIDTGPGERAERIRRDAYLYELLVFALALRVVIGGETPARFRELAGEGFDRLLGTHERAAGQSST